MALAIDYKDHLLPPNATDAERALATVTGRVTAIPTPIDIVKRPMQTPAAFLPFAAWEYSVDVWNEDWPQARKRAVTQRSIALHMRKGTAYCIREYVRYADGAVLSIERPPMKTFSGPSLTREERERWLSGLPQVRVWRMRESAPASVFKAFYGGYHAGRRSFFADTAAVPSTALSRLRRRARWVVDGVETETRVSELGSYFRLHFRSVEGRRAFSGRCFGRRHFIPSDAWRRLVTIQPQPRLAWRSAAGPTLTPVNAEPERVKIGGHRGRSVFCDLPMRAGFHVPSTARFRIFDRYAVHDGRRVARRSPVQFMGVGRYGFPTHTARLHLSVPGRRSPFAAGAGVSLPKARFWMPHDRARLERVRRAVQSAKRLSDKILLVIGPRARFVAGQPFLAAIDKFIIGRP